MAILVAVLLLLSQVAAGPITRAIHEARTDISGLEILQIALSLKVLLTFFAIVSVSMVTVVYGLLIRRGSFMATTTMYPISSIQANIANLLSSAWPNSSDMSHQNNFGHDQVKETAPGRVGTERSTQDAIRLFYLGRMAADGNSTRVAKGVRQCAAQPVGKPYSSSLWLTNGSPIMKSIVQLLIWEWVSLWLVLLTLLSTLIYNGFFTDELNLDSYPRLVVIIIYSTFHLIHFYYVWSIFLTFFTKVAAGSAWSLLERANFAIGEAKRLRNCTPRKPFEFRSINKASEEHVPKIFSAYFKHEADVDGSDAQNIPVMAIEREEDIKDVSAALRSLDGTQKIERETARVSAGEALDRVIANAMIMMGVTLSTGFCAWTARQTTENTPNNFISMQIGSLALLASLSLGVATMFSSALHLSVMESSFHTNLSLKEIKINGQAVDHYKKRLSQYSRVSFLDGNVPLSRVRFWDVLAVNRVTNFLGTLLLGPALGLLPRAIEYDRRSEQIGFDLWFSVRDNDVLFTTRQTDGHQKYIDGSNIETINVCYLPRSVVCLSDKV